MVSRVFILSPANCAGQRAKMVLRQEASFDLARRLGKEGVPLGELFSFLSGLYFRGKLEYASMFAKPAPSCPGILIITPCRGLLTPDAIVTQADLRLFAATDIRGNALAYIRPLMADASKLSRCPANSGSDFVLLGSIATDKYLSILLQYFASRLLFPRDFVGRGDMSRGGLLLRRAANHEELQYVAVSGAVRHGKRPPKLDSRH